MSATSFSMPFRDYCISIMITYAIAPFRPSNLPNYDNKVMGIILLPDIATNPGLFQDFPNTMCKSASSSEWIEVRKKRRETLHHPLENRLLKP